MPLIDLKTSLKSLKFGKDRPYEGSSNQPYIQSSIPEGDIPTSGGTDFLLRGGILAPIRAAKDVSRLTQMFFDLKSPNGFQFIAKQNLLSRTSVQTQASSNGGAAYAAGAVNQGVYLPSSTLAQAGVGFTGTHLNLLGIDPSSPMSGITNKGISDLFSTSLTLGLKRYEDVVKENPDGFDPSKNRLYELSTKNGLILSQTPQSQDDKKDPKNFFQKVGNFLQNFSINSPGNGILMDYSGGPGSILGVGKTIIPFADRRTGKTIGKLKDDGFFTKGYSVFGRKNTVTLSNPIQNTSPANINYINTVPSGSTKGASSTYGSLTGNLVDNYILYKENQRRDTNDFSVYQPGTLTPGLLATNFKDFQSNKLPTINYTGSVPSGSIKGVSSKYENLTRQNVDNFIVYNNNQQISTNNFNVYQPGTFEPSVLATTQTGPFKGTDIYTYNQSQLIDASNNNIKQAFKEDFRKPLIPSQSSFNTILSISPSYIDSNYAKRTNAGDPGFSNTAEGIKNVLNYTQASGNGIAEDYKIALDKITAGAIYSATTALHNPDNGEYAGNDLVKFSIGVVQNNTTGLSNFMHFRAFIDSFSDSYNADWGSYNYVGRGDKFYNYEGFERTINLSFTVFAQSKAELIPMYKKLNYLASSLAPDYSEKSGFMKGNLHKLTIGGYLFDQVGIIKSITYDIPEETPWEIGINNQPEAGYDTSVKELPHMIKVTNLSFIPIQNFLPRVANPSNQSKTRYIALATNTSDDDTNYTKVRT
jgi:hypothetical protein